MLAEASESKVLAKAAKPEWLKIRPPGGENYSRVKELLKDLKLHTVCEEAKCPNVAECWGGGTATVMLLGDTCTRGCRFCHVKTGNPKGVVDHNEPKRVAEAVVQMGLRYLVLTSVDRDDLPDGGADHFAQTVEEIKKRNADIVVEVLIPDFLAEDQPIARIVSSGAEVIAHNLETVSRLTPQVRDVRCQYNRSLEVLQKVKKLSPTTYTKSSLMLGMGETREEISQAMDDLRVVNVDIVTLGQYLRPTAWHLPVQEYIHPTVFAELEIEGLSKGFINVPSGPLVRSSYKAAEKFLEGKIREQRLRRSV